MNHLLALGTIWSLLVATVSVVFAVLSHRRQVNASVYLDLSRQLHELYKRMPTQPHTEPSGGDALRALVFDSFQLIRTAYTLSAAGYFSGSLWVALKNDAEKGLRKPPFRELWPAIKVEFACDPDFIAYVEAVQSSTGTDSASAQRVARLTRHSH